MDTFLLLCLFWATVFSKPRPHLPNVWQEAQGTTSLHNRAEQQWQAQTPESVAGESPALCLLCKLCGELSLSVAPLSPWKAGFTRGPAL